MKTMREFKGSKEIQDAITELLSNCIDFVISQTVESHSVDEYTHQWIEIGGDLLAE